MPLTPSNSLQIILELLWLKLLKVSSEGSVLSVHTSIFLSCHLSLSCTPGHVHHVCTSLLIISLDSKSNQQMKGEESKSAIFWMLLIQISFVTAQAWSLTLAALPCSHIPQIPELLLRAICTALQLPEQRFGLVPPLARTGSVAAAW